MRTFSILALAAGAAVQAQSFSEPADFNVTAALVDLGVDVSALPELDSLSQWSSTAGCSIAVSLLQTRYL